VILLFGAARAATPIEDVDPAAAVLWVGVHREAGDLSDVAADGASGQCVSEATWIRCPAASGPVTFRWGPAGAGDWRLFGQDASGDWRPGPVVVAPGEGRAAVVLADDAARTDPIARLGPEAVTPEEVRAQFVRTGDHVTFAPSPAQLAALVALVRHPDPAVRRELPDALLPWLRHTGEDPLPIDAPPVIPPGTLLALARDRDPTVRRRLAGRIRDVRDGGAASVEAAAALKYLVTTGGGAQRAALVGLGARSKEGEAPALDAWRVARVRMHDPGPPGRAAVKTLAALATELAPGGEVDPAAAIAECLALHPERTWSLWTAWRRAVPLDPALLGRMLRDTVGWSPSLLTYWAKSSPDALESVFRAWESGPPHTERWHDLLAGLALLPDPRWVRLRDDNLSGPGEAPQGP
jgi:hypothetical protein